jgi:cyclopropane-fatty-acyl-phospholipid synthase
MVHTVSLPAPAVPRAGAYSLAPWAGADEIAGQIAHDTQSNIHYDMPVEVFRYILGPSMKYSSGLWDAEHTTLEAAQEANLRQVVESLALTPESHVLDVGCGWGAFALYAARQTGCRVTGIGLAPRPIAYAAAQAQAAGLDRLTTFRECHVLALPDPPDTFTHVVFFETFEHMRLKRETLAACRRVLRAPGTLYMQVIGVKSPSYREQMLSRPGTEHVYATYGDVGDPVPLSTVIAAVEENDFEVREVRSISAHYPATLNGWAQNTRRHHAAIDALTEPGRAASLRKYFLLGFYAYTHRLGVNHQIWARLLPAG